ncbi:hypothetical protein BJN34_30240 [Cupriavidus necator]|uniref:Uncharacterized protein n=1 Tax=Cupriavidus necator TaxID=106590 RepID=A0A1U9V0Z4_CUPNE|nr:hypothetical protein [Cupriavidus necator]AQV98151.1 hypothetical protein BJN34_30240 [Cupriavidus necator]
MRRVLTVCLTATAMLSGCGGGGDTEPLARLASVSTVTGIGATTNFGFDLGTVLGNRYYFTDRTNASVDVFDTSTRQQVAQIKPTGANAFAGSFADFSISGPAGINVVGNLLYVGDVNSVKILDPATGTITKTITVGNFGKRADEGCVDPVHHMYMISTPEAPVPFATFIDTVSQTVVATVTFNDPAGAPSAGLEECQYDAATDSFYVNNDGTTDNEHGELNVLPGAAIRAIPSGGTVNFTDLAGAKMFSLGNCDPTGLALGPGNDIAANCREATAGAPLLLQILDKKSGNILASLNAGGGDQLVYDAASNRYYSAASRWTTSGKSSGASCTAAAPCSPMLTMVDAGTRKIAAMVSSGNNAHSVAVDPATRQVFMPTSADASPPGCSGCNIGTAGLLTFAL